jgi:hypothetical protein
MTRFSVNLTADQSSFSSVARRTPAKTRERVTSSRRTPRGRASKSREAGTGIEPVSSGFADRGLTTWLPRRILLPEPIRWLSTVSILFLVANCCQFSGTTRISTNVRPTIAHRPVQRKQGVQVLSGWLQSQWQAKALFFKGRSRCRSETRRTCQAAKKEGQDGLDVPLDLRIMAVTNEIYPNTFFPVLVGIRAIAGTSMNLEAAGAVSALGFQTAPTGLLLGQLFPRRRVTIQSSSPAGVQQERI